MNEQARTLNETLQQENPFLLDLFSKAGLDLFFPKLGILSQSAEAAGKRINATIGIAMEEDGRPMYLKTIHKYLGALQPGEVYTYAPSPGKKELREAWKEMLFKKNPGLTGKEISQPIVTGALTHGLSTAGELFLNQGEEIIIPSPYWENYDLMFLYKKGARIKTFDLFSDGGFNITGLADALNGNAKALLLLNFPNNPTGFTPTIEEARQIVATIREAADRGKAMVVLVDDAYFGLVYVKDIITESLFSQLADLHERVLAVKLDGPTKEDYVWGFRIGFITYGIGGSGDKKKIYAALEAKTAGAIRADASNMSHLGQSLLYKAYQDPEYWSEKQQKNAILHSRYREVTRVLSDKKYEETFQARPYNSGYFMCLKLRNADPEAVRKKLLDQYDTGVISVEPDLIRVAFSSTPTRFIPELIENIYQACRKI
ncbi:MAG: aminotransferase class I/II-fold pyridoxal phosphate-dependent enzyme [Deltaproteobacteria bacterium]|nr:aminotransferase class I/II-fold pyridoxal phosphate-dependent enzyme [Deltaproteobacteria bacterium]